MAISKTLISVIGVIIVVIVVGVIASKYTSILKEEILTTSPTSNQEFLESSKKTAESFAKDIFEDAVFGSSVPYYGLDDKLAGYAFTFSLKGKPFPSEEEILNEIAEGTKIVERGEELRDESLIKLGQKMIVGEGKYGTIEVSVKDNNPSVILHSQGLSIHYTAIEKAREMAEKALNTSDVELKRYISDPLTGFLFEFISAKKIIYVSPFPFRTFTKEELDLKVKEGKEGPVKIGP